VPEGDTIHRVANRMRPVLVGQPVVRFEAPRAGRAIPPPRPGTTITGVDAVGKHLLIRFEGGTILRTHLRMTGSWHLYAPGERWRRPAHTARALIEVPHAVAVCFAAPVVALEHERVNGGPAIGHLGPDLVDPDADIDACLARMAALAEPTAEIGDVLLDQRIACGVGNVYKSEVLWAGRVDPFAPVASVDVDIRRLLLDTAARLLRSNVARADASRTTVVGGLAVYGRARRTCRRCGTPIRVARQGDDARVTYWCPTCQPPAGAPAPT
jgi:endonuclease-8